MKKTLQFTVIVAGLVALPVFGANTVKIDKGSYQFPNSGEFRATDNGSLNLSGYAKSTGDGLNIFQTFCLEVQEGLTFGDTYNYVVNTKAVEGKVGPAGDPISIGTAWLYSKFAAGTLTGYNWTSSYDSTLGGDTVAQTAARTASAGLLQEAIWALEDEILPPVPLANPFYDAALTVANYKNDALGAYNVYVLNLTDKDGKKHQDVLVVVPEPSTYVAAALLLIPAIFQARRMRRTA